MATNPTREISVSFGDYVAQRNEQAARHLDGGIADYAFGEDFHIRQKIQRIPGLVAFCRAITSYSVPLERQKANMRFLRVGPQQMPDVYQMTVDCARRLGIGIPTVYIDSSTPGLLNAYAMATEDNDPLIVITTSLLERMAPGELKTIIGHECGHIHNLHGIYNTAALLLTLPPSMIPGLQQVMNLLTVPITLALQSWSRAAEVTCDRAGIICADDPQDAISAEAKFLHGGARGRDAVDIEPLIRQYETLKNSPTRFSELMSTHPFTLRRIMANRVFLDSEVLYRWRPEWKRPEAELLDKQALEARTRDVIGVMRGKKEASQHG